MNQNRESAFTLLELIATVAVVGILAGIAFTLYKSYDERATSLELIELYGVLREETTIDADAGGIDLCADPPVSLITDTPSSPYSDLSIVKTDLGYGKPIGLHFKADVATEGEHNTSIVRETYNTLNKTALVAPDAVVNDSVVSFTALLVNTPCTTTNVATTSPASAPVPKSQAPSFTCPAGKVCGDHISAPQAPLQNRRIRYATQTRVARTDDYWLRQAGLISPDGSPMQIIDIKVDPAFAGTFKMNGQWGFQFVNPGVQGQTTVTVEVANDAGTTTAQFNIATGR